jgi:DNA repair exonuclease SbcCD ATPase subunit
MSEASNETESQFELSLFMDITQFDELERRVSALIDSQEKLKAHNRELQARVSSLENQANAAAEETQRLMAEREELLANQRDPKKEEQIRRKISEMLARLEGV